MIVSVSMNSRWSEKVRRGGRRRAYSVYMANPSARRDVLIYSGRRVSDTICPFPFIRTWPYQPNRNRIFQSANPWPVINRPNLYFIFWVLWVWMSFGFFVHPYVYVCVLFLYAFSHLINLIAKYHKRKKKKHMKQNYEQSKKAMASLAMLVAWKIWK
jgi:hypothetical protein